MTKRGKDTTFLGTVNAVSNSKTYPESSPGESGEAAREFPIAVTCNGGMSGKPAEMVVHRLFRLQIF